MSFMWNVVLVIIALVIVRISKWLWQWSNPKSTGKLPPGSMGFPIIGETLEFFKPGGLLEIPPFIQKRMLRYGSLFRTNILGSNTVISTDVDVIYEVLRQENKSFVLSYPDAFVKIFGKDNLFFKTGNIHKHVKQTSMHLVGSEALKQKMIGSMNRATREHLREKASEGVVFSLRDAISSMVSSFMTPSLISDLEPETQAKLIDHFKAFNFDWFKSPFAPSAWMLIYKVLKAGREATKVINKALERRKESGDKQGDFLDTLLEEMEKEGSVYKKESVISLLLSLGVVSNDTISSTAALTVNFLSKNPKVLAELKREHEAILEKRANKEAELSWEEYRYNTNFTSMVINESLRLTTLGSIFFRKAVKDVQIKGYTIPAGWIVAVAPPVIHFNSKIYENPLEFNPWRWEGKDMRSGSKSLMVFGGGMRQCVGADFARLQLSVFFHHLVTTYDFSVVQECEVIRRPFLCFTKDLLLNIIHK